MNQSPAASIVPPSIHKWQMIGLIAVIEFLAMTVWFSASAVIPALTETWNLTASGQAWLTMSVQIGFVVGAFGSSVLNIADRIPTKQLLAASAFLAGIFTGLIPLVANGITSALVLRFLTGVVLAGVYPVGMKLMTTWTVTERGLGIGLLVGALTLGSAAPHLFNAFGSVDNWQIVLYIAALLSIIAAIITLLVVQEGPHRKKTAPFNPRYIRQIFSQRDLLTANLGYWGHMWELYAMWAWIPIFLLDSFALQHVDPRWARIGAFAVIGIGGVGSLIAGYYADRIGRTTVTMIAMIISGSSALLIGFLYGGAPWLVMLVSLIWGITIVADSAQFSAAASELCHPEYIGTALTLQTSVGFLITLASIRLIPVLQNAVGWEWAFAILAIGPLFGTLSMAWLRRAPTAYKLASGRR